MKYRQKPIEVDAFQFTKDSEVYAPEWFSDAVKREEIFIDRSIIDGSANVYGCSIKKAGGWNRAKVGDFIIKEPTVDITVCSEAVFCRIYQHIDGREVESMACKGKSKGKGGKRGKGK